MAQEVPEQLQLCLFEHAAFHRHGLGHADEPALCPVVPMMQLLHAGKWLIVIVFKTSAGAKAPFDPDIHKGSQSRPLAGERYMLDTIAPAQLIAGANAYRALFA